MRKLALLVVPDSISRTCEWVLGGSGITVQAPDNRGLSHFLAY